MKHFIDDGKPWDISIKVGDPSISLSVIRQETQVWYSILHAVLMNTFANFV